MSAVTLLVQRLPHFRGELPSYESAHASGFDVRAQLETPVLLRPGERALVPTGLSFAIPPGFEIQVRPRSGWASKKGITVVNAPGTVDADYRGEVKIALVNLGQEPHEIQDQDRVAQLVVCPVLRAVFEDVRDLPTSERGAGGFGSTGFR
ncbi:MAG: dUTP diphosphatase [Bdellovibrionales bacterium]|nr:dUTP diphosphatase [Bdellovibrionales bacterium]